MKTLTAIYKSENGLVRHMTSNSYKTAKDFKSDCYRNGFKAVTVLTNTALKKIKNLKPSELPQYNDRLISYVKEVI